MAPAHGLRQWLPWVFAMGLLAAPALSRGDAAATLGQAQAHLLQGEHAEALDLARAIATDSAATKADRAEAWRLCGLASYLLGATVDAEAAFFEYLKLEPDAHLDPTLFPPEALAFFEGVRARHSGDLAKLRPRPPGRPRHVALNFIPPAGQFQNGERGKGMAIGIAEAVLLATNVVTYIILRDACGVDCGEDPSTARRLKSLNVTAGALLVGVVVYGVIDGLVVFRRERPVALGVSASRGSGDAISVTFRF